ncbi:sigma-70 family RNA polymerase sigma factor [Luteolibacter sp. SL250]|uniref:RNA polymerase sigma factor n=1 Tax=Luteolibacter sp. SL250 TaxID=2995170 RepID=UPI00226DDAF4|nr:sigma-70 family RNA polymerase sigma factor [Luteolibacter sp. SL250]WAC20335.1 sigma-70 family RNA polymerase sigma factor [Luteolibacter sp. SL250]
MPDSDATLLTTFAATRDEKSFRTLADRYLGLIFHTALRRTGNRPLAEEVSQNVLCAMARKAGNLARHPERLAPWLHRATILESLKAMRSECSYQRRKHLPPPEETPSSPGSGSIWTDAVPLLDGALDKLPEADRTVLMLHFFGNRSFPQIAGILGKSADAVQKQSRRALEKLSRLLRARGVALSASVIAAGLSAEFAKAAPVSLAATAAAAAWSTPSSTGPITALLSMKPKVLIPAAVLVCGLPLAVQQSAISSAAARNRELTASAPGGPAGGGAPSRQRVVATATGGAANLDFIALGDRWDGIRRSLGNHAMPGTPDLQAEAYAADLENLDTPTLVELIRKGAAETMNRDTKYATLRTLAFTLAKRDPRLALETLLTAFPAGVNLPRALNRTGAGNILGHWAAADPRAAYDWFQAGNLRERYGPELGVSSPRRDSLGELTIPLLDSLLLSDPGLARELVLSLPEAERPTFFGNLTMGTRSKNTGITFTGEGRPPAPVRKTANLLALFREFAPSQVAKELPVIFQPGSVAPRDLEEFLAGVDFTEAEKIMVARHLARMARSSVRQPDGTVVERINGGMMEVAKRLAPDLASQLAADAGEESRKRDAGMAQAQLQILNAPVELGDPAISMILMNHDFSGHLDEALKHAERIKDPEKRAQVIEKLRRTK